MAKLKDVLKQPLSAPRGIEVKLPKGMPSVSGVLASIADSLPAGPDIPVGGLGGMSAGKSLPRVTSFIKGVEGVVPQLPKLSPLANSIEAPTVGKVEDMIGKFGGMLGGGGESTAPTKATKPGIIPLFFE